MQILLLVGLLAVAAIHTRSRLAGAVAAAVWCSCGLVYGVSEFQDRPSLAFLGIETPGWLYVAFYGGLITFNVSVILRALRRARSTSR